MLAGAAGGTLAAATSTPTDYAGIAMIIAASGSVIGTIGGLIIAIQRRRSSAEELAAALRELRELEQHGGTDVAT